MSGEHKKGRRHTDCLLLLLGLLGPVSSHSQSPAAQRPPSAPARRALTTDHVAGRVLRTTDKRPVAGATVSLNETPNRSTVASTRTDAEGRYSFDAQPAGKYNLQASAPGYLSSSYLEHEGFSTAIVLGAGLKTDDLTLELTPSAAITGHIFDDSGDPVQHATLTLFRESSEAASEAASSTGPRIVRFRSAQTEDDGSFEFTGVAPGNFYLSATATPWYAVHPRSDGAGNYVPYRTAVDPALDVAYPELFYPAARSPEEATPFVIKAGEHLTADMVLRAEHAITLTFRLPPLQPGEAPRYRVPQLSRSVFGIEQAVFSQNSMGDGQTITLTGLTPGHYTLRQFSPNGGPVFEAGSVEIGREPVTMDLPPESASAGAPVIVKPSGAGGGTLPSEVRVALRSTGLNSRTLQSRPKEDGTAEFAAVPSGDYRISAFREGRSLAVLAVGQDGKPVPSKRVHISGSDPVKVDLILSPYAPTIEGFAQSKGQGKPGSMVLLVPAGADTSEDLFRRDQSDLDGSFVLRNVVPGNYLLVAIDDGWPLRWTDTAVLLPYLLHAVPITVPTSGASTIHLSEPALVQPR